MKKPVKIIAAVLALLVLSAAVAVYAVWHNELASVASFRQIRTRNDPHDDGSVYELHIKGGYYMDELLAQGGVASDSELISFAVEHITKGLIPVSIKNPEIGCSSFTAQTAAGDKLFARNYDMRKTNTCIVHTESGNGRHATISTVDLGLLGMDADTDVEGLLKKITCLAAVYALVCDFSRRAERVQAAISTETEKITQPNGAAAPRNSDTYKRIAVPKAFYVLLEYIRPRPKSGKVRRSDTRPGDFRERAERSEGSNSAPVQNTPCFGV